MPHQETQHTVYNLQGTKFYIMWDVSDLQGTKFYTIWDVSDLQIRRTSRHNITSHRAKLQPIQRAHDKKSKTEVTVTRV